MPSLSAPRIYFKYSFPHVAVLGRACGAAATAGRRQSLGSVWVGITLRRDLPQIVRQEPRQLRFEAVSVGRA
jgi:hypothetical protein